jgi:hypothetical protein
MVIVQHFPGSVKEYIDAVLSRGSVLIIPDRCPHPDCQTVDALIRWGSYARWACTVDEIYRLRIQRVRCKACGRTHSLLPDFLHPHRQYVIELLQQVVFLYLLTGLGWGRLMSQLSESGPARSTVREWIASFIYGAGELLLDWLRRQLLVIVPLAELPSPSPEHLPRVADPTRRRRLQRTHRFWLLAEQLYAQIKVRLPHLHFTASHLFPFLLHWLQNQALPSRLFWSPTLPNTPSTPF